MTANATGRASNLELLRILGILMIVMMHICEQGGFPVVHNPAVAFLASAGRLSVNIFLLIGCWFMVDAPFRPERIAKLYLQVVFYSVPITLLMFATCAFGSSPTISTCLPYNGSSASSPSST